MNIILKNFLLSCISYCMLNNFCYSISVISGVKTNVVANKGQKPPNYRNNGCVQKSKNSLRNIYAPKVTGNNGGQSNANNRLQSNRNLVVANRTTNQTNQTNNNCRQSQQPSSNQAPVALDEIIKKNISIMACKACQSQNCHKIKWTNHGFKYITDGRNSTALSATVLESALREQGNNCTKYLMYLLTIQDFQCEQNLCQVIQQSRKNIMFLDNITKSIANDWIEALVVNENAHNYSNTGIKLNNPSMPVEMKKIIQQFVITNVLNFLFKIVDSNIDNITFEQFNNKVTISANVLQQDCGVDCNRQQSNRIEISVTIVNGKIIIDNIKVVPVNNNKTAKTKQQKKSKKSKRNKTKKAVKNLVNNFFG